MSAAATCRNCGATLSPELDWCPQCFTPVPGAKPVAAAGGDTAEGAAGPDGEDHVDAATSIEDLPSPTMSVWRSGPYSFGPVGKLLITVLVLLGGFVLYLTAKVIGDFYGHPGLGLVLILEAVYLVFAILILWGVWRPERVNKPGSFPKED